MVARETQPPRSISPYAVLIAAVFAVLLLAFVYSVAHVLLLLFIATLFSLYLGAITDYLEDRVRVPRPVGLLGAVLFSLALAVGIGWLVVPPVLRQTQALLSSLPDQVTLWVQGFRDLVARYPLLAQVLPPEEVDRQLQGLVGSADGSVDPADAAAALEIVFWAFPAEERPRAIAEALDGIRAVYTRRGHTPPTWLNALAEGGGIPPAP